MIIYNCVNLPLTYKYMIEVSGGYNFKMFVDGVRSIVASKFHKCGNLLNMM